MSVEFKINEFEGPLDLLLHLIKESKMDIMNIEIEEITKQYMSYLESQEKMNLEIASEYLVLASELIEIKSKLLLPNIKNEDNDTPSLDKVDEDPEDETIVNDIVVDDDSVAPDYDTPSLDNVDEDEEDESDEITHTIETETTTTEEEVKEETTTTVVETNTDSTPSLDKIEEDEEDEVTYDVEGKSVILTDPESAAAQTEFDSKIEVLETKMAELDAKLIELGYIEEEEELATATDSVKAFKLR